MSNNLNFLASRVLKQPMLMRSAEHSVISSYLTARITNDYREFDSLAAAKKYESRQYAYIQDGIGIIPVIGALSHRDQLDAECMPVTSYESLRSDYDKLMEDVDVEVVVFEIDSGGGEARGCFDLCRYIYETRDRKPVLAYVNENAYSAAYAIASACHQIIIPPTAGVGSIGVIAGRIDQTKQYQAAGVQIDLITAGKFKADLHPLQPYTAEERERIQSEVNALATEFYDMVAAHRGSDSSDIKALEAGTFTGNTAIQHGLADSIMSQEKFYQYLILTEKTLMFKNPFSQESAADRNISEAEHNAALKAQKDELVNQAKQSFLEQLGIEKKKWQQSELSRQKSIVDTANGIGKSDMALELILSQMPLDEAKKKLFASASDVTHIFTNEAAISEVGPNGDDGNIMLKAVKDIAKQFHSVKV